MWLEIANEVYEISDHEFRIHSKINFMVIFTSSSPWHAITRAFLKYKLNSRTSNMKLLLPSLVVIDDKPPN